MQEIILYLKQYTFFGNTTYEYALAVVIFVGAILILKIFQSIVLYRLRKLAKKTKTDFDDALIEIFQKIKPPFYSFASLYFAIKILVLPMIISQVIEVLIIIWVVYEVVLGLQRFIDYFAKKYLSKLNNSKEGKKQSKAMVSSISTITKIILWLLGITVVLANLGFNVTSLVASMGIGGLAIALAAQNMLGDIFSSFSIYIDKPFMVGDLITVGTETGTVEKIGLKTTRLRTIRGEELIISNNELTSAKIQNFKSLKKRRNMFVLGVTYDTSRDNLRKIPKLIRELISKEKKSEFGRCYFKEFADSSLNYEVMYYVNSESYDEFSKIVHKLNLAIFAKFQDEGIEFAYPTQTLLVENYE